MADFTERLTDSKAMDFIDQVNAPFKNLPHLPQGVIDFLAMIAPWLVLLSGILTLIFSGLYALVGSLGSLLSLSPVMMITVVVGVIVAFAQAALLLMAFTPLQKRQEKGWILLFWSDILSIVTLVVGAIQGNASGLVGGVIGMLIGFYILFEMRPAYGKVASVTKAVKDEVKKLD